MVSVMSRVAEMPLREVEEYDNETKIRKRIAEIYCREPSDFETLGAYDDYLEQREDIVHALLNDEDVEKVEQQVADYKQANQESILKHKRRRIEQANASFATSLSKGTLEGVVDSAGTEGQQQGCRPKPVPLTEYELTPDGSLKVLKLPQTSAEWETMARSAGWMRRNYMDLALKNFLEELIH